MEMNDNQVRELATECSQHIVDGKPEQARVLLRQHPPEVIEAVRRYYVFMGNHAAQAYRLVHGVMDEAKRPAVPASQSMNAEQSAAIYATDPYADMGHGRTRVQHPL